MRENYGVCIQGRSVVLVPYRKKFVTKYHNWMMDPFLLEMTASEPLSLEGEYQMQSSWKEDPKKCTFIVLNSEDAKSLTSSTAAEIEAMAGDVNMFLNDYEDSGVAELEVMIAESSMRRRGLGKEAIILMMHYGITKLGIWKFYVKIGAKNESSLHMFRSMGFDEVNYVAAFAEYELQYIVGPVDTALPDEVVENRGSVASSSSSSSSSSSAAAAAAVVINTVFPTMQSMENSSSSSGSQDAAAGIPIPRVGTSNGSTASTGGDDDANSRADDTTRSGDDNSGGSSSSSTSNMTPSHNRQKIIDLTQHAVYLPYWDSSAIDE